MRRLVYYVAVSIDGFIADPSGDTSAFPVRPDTLADLFARYPETCPVQARESLGVTAPPRRFDTVIMGRRTAQPALDAGLTAGAYPHLRQIVVAPGDLVLDEGIERWDGDLARRAAALKDSPGRDIWLCGGGETAAQLIDQIDELQLKVNPVVLGAGVPLVAGTAHGLPRPLELIASEPLPAGVVLQTYRRA